jgi:hypothetical protein
VQGWDDEDAVFDPPVGDPLVVAGIPGELNEEIIPRVPGVIKTGEDEGLHGINAEVALHALGVHTLASSDLEVTLDIRHAPTDTDGDELTLCDEMIRGTSPDDADSDDDFLDDGEEVAVGSNPLNPHSDADGLLDGQDNCPTESNVGQEDHDGDGDGDACDTDDDNDGIADESDAFPNSDLSPIVVIAGCNSRVANLLLADGATFNDRIGECAAQSATHGAYVSCVTAWADLWKKAGVLTKVERGRILQCASLASSP